MAETTRILEVEDEEIPYFMENEEWYYHDEDKWRYYLTEKAPPEAVKSYHEFYAKEEANGWM